MASSHTKFHKHGIDFHLRANLLQFLMNYAEKHLTQQDRSTFSTQINAKDSVTLTIDGFVVKTKSEEYSLAVQKALAEIFNVAFDQKNHQITVQCKDLKEANEKLEDANSLAAGISSKRKTHTTRTTTSSTTTVSLALSVTMTATTTTITTPLPSSSASSKDKLSDLTAKAKAERKRAAAIAKAESDAAIAKAEKDAAIAKAKEKADKKNNTISDDAMQKANEVMLKLNTLKAIYLIVHPGKEEKEITHTKSGYSLPAKYHSGFSKLAGVALPSMFSFMGKAMKGMKTLAIAFEQTPLIGRYSTSEDKTLLDYLKTSRGETFKGTTITNKNPLVPTAALAIEQTFDEIANLVAVIRQRKDKDDPIYGGIFAAFRSYNSETLASSRSQLK